MYKRMQEPFNEEIASEILKANNIDHVHYELKRTEEYYRKDQYSHYLEMCGKNGLTNAREKIIDIISLSLQKNEKLKTGRIEKITAIVKQRMDIMDKLCRQ